MIIQHKIQLWQNGVMIGLIPQNEAKELVTTGDYRIINTQSIEWIGELDIGC